MTRFGTRSLAPILFVAFLAGAGAPARAGTAGGGAKELEAELAAKAAEALEAGMLGKLRVEIESRLRAGLAGKDPLDRDSAPLLETLEHYRNVSAFFDCKPDEETRAFLKWLLAQRKLCARFCHALDARDDPVKAIAIFKRLKAVEKLDERTFLAHGELAIALAVIWDGFRWHRWARHPVAEDQPEQLLVYYAKPDPRMALQARALPYELLVFVVNHPLSAEEREFALAEYGRGYSPRKAFFDVEWNKKLSPAHGTGRDIPYTLMNIRKLGGVCMEQAYFSSCVGKCVGLPAVYCCGAGKRGGHAWVGALRQARPGSLWNFKAGRYSYDHYWKGVVDDPTARTRLTDGEVMMTAGCLAVPIERRERAAARRNLALWLWRGCPEPQARPAGRRGRRRPVERVQPGEPVEPPAELSDDQKKLVHKLLLEAVELDPFSRRTWDGVAVVAASRTFSVDEAQMFNERLFRHIGKVSPDFVCHTFRKFLGVIEEQAVRDRMYEQAFAYFRARPDLGAELKVAQGAMWEKDGAPEKALDAYVDALASFPKDGHVTMSAARRIDQVLAKGEPAKAVAVLEKLWVQVSAQRGSLSEKREALRIVGENLLKYMRKTADKRLEQFEADFRKFMPEKRE